MTERDDPILDACLEEVLGGRTPPDLTARILRAWAESSRPEGDSPSHVSDVDAQGVVAPPVQFPRNGGQRGADQQGAGQHDTGQHDTGQHSWQVAVPLPPPIAAGAPHQINANDGGWVAPANRVPRGGTRTRVPANSGSMWQSIALVLLVVFTGTTVGLVALNMSSKQGTTTPGVTASGAKSGGARPDVAAQNGAKRTPAELAESRDASRNKRKERDPSAANGRTVAGAPRTAPRNVAPPVVVQDKPSSDDPTSPLKPVVAQAISDEAVVRSIDEALHREWKLAGVSPAEPATDAEWCRRVYLRVIGRIPSVDEVDRYVSNRSSAKRVELIDELLGPRYAEAYASHWATIWSNALLSRRELGDKSLANRDGLQEFLRDSLASGKSFDQLATDLIAASGSNRRDDGDYNPAVNFLLAHAQGTGVQAAGRVARVFLGARLQCAECHVHPAGSWSQDQLWQLAAFFRQMKTYRDASDGTARLANEDFRGQGKDPSEAASYFELANGQLKAAFPTFLDGTPGSRSGVVAEVDRRAELARFVVHSPQFTRTTVNRLWAHFLGFGFTQPVDDLGPHNQPSHPEILDRVAADFASQGFDLKRLTRWIVLSESFGLSSKEMPDSLVDSPEFGRRPLFARYYSRPMQPEELSKSLQMLVDARGKPGGSAAEQARLIRQFGRALPADDTDAPPGSRPRIPQALIDVQRGFTSHEVEGAEGGLVRKVAENKAMSVDQKIDHLFQAALARKPSAQELQVARRLVADSPADIARGLQDIWWVLLNSNEFILDH